MDPRTEAHNLIDLALTVLPEGEGMIELGDRGYTIEQLAQLRAELARMRKAIDVAAAGLAQAWIDEGRDESVVIGNTRFRLGFSRKSPRWAFEGADVKFADWLKSQDDETVAAIVPPYGIRIGQVSDSARDTFFDESRTDADLRIKYNNDDFIYGKVVSGGD